MAYTKKEPKLVRTVKSRGKHRTELRYYLRESAETYCVHPRCKYRGKRAEQGVCFTTKPFDGGDWKYLNAVERGAEQHLEEIRKQFRGKPRIQYLRYIEAAFVCSEMNSVMGLDELIRLRRRIALMR